jgi:hypothetical protein
MNLAVLVIIAVTLGLLLIVVLPRLRGVGGSDKTTVERRSGAERRRKKAKLPVDRRHRPRRTEDAARAFVDGLGE